MDEQHDIDAIGLLRHLVNQVMQQRNLDELEDAVGVSIVPLGATGLWAGGMDFGSPRFYAAIDKLLEAGALEHDEETNKLLSSEVREPEAFKITQGGIELLRRDRGSPPSTT